jgi:pyridoxamine 5'-phosphate oxidase
MSDLAATLATAWDTLAAGVHDRTAPARHIVLATTGAEGPEARLLVLRATDRAAGTLTLWTDAATAKASELARDPRAALLVWDPEQRLQIRLRARVALRPGTPAEWKALPAAARALYGGTPAPGTAIPAPDAHRATASLARFAILTRHRPRDRNPPPWRPP